MTNDSTVSCYDEQAQAYDLYQTAVVPGYQTMLDLTAQTCRRVLKSNAKIIDLGCGTGNASLATAKVIPVQIYLIDGSKQMVQVAESKLSQVASAEILGRKVANISEENWDEYLPSDEYDAVVSTLVLEHLPFDRYKRTIEKCQNFCGRWLIIAAEGYVEPEAICNTMVLREMAEHQKW